VNGARIDYKLYNVLWRHSSSRQNKHSSKIFASFDTAGRAKTVVKHQSQIKQRVRSKLNIMVFLQFSAEPHFTPQVNSFCCKKRENIRKPQWLAFEQPTTW
jgi:hypothetical protein